MFLRRESLKEYVKSYPVVSLILLVQLLAFGLMEAYGSSTSVRTLLDFGAMFKNPFFQPEPWRYVTAVFLHIGFQHLLLNSFALYVFAAPLERMLGSWRFLLFYVACGIVGNAVSYMLHMDNYIGAGASGAIYGVYAAFLLFAFFRKDLIHGENAKTIMIIVIVGFIHSIVIPNVDLYGHAGGFACGLIAAAALSLTIRKRGYALPDPLEPDKS